MKATAIGSISILLWGTLALFTQLTGGKIPPFQLLSMAFGVAFVVMATNWLRKGHVGQRYLRQPWQVWVLGVGSYFAFHFCYFMAMRFAPAIQVSLIAYMWPLLIVLLSSFLPEHRFRWQYIVGGGVALAGCWVLMGGVDALMHMAKGELKGYLFAAACAFIWSGYSVLSRLTQAVSTDVVGWFCCFTALLSAICHLLLETTVWPTSGIQWSGILLLGLGPMGVAFFTWDYGIKHGNLPLLGVLSYGAPLISVVLLAAFTEAVLTKATIIAAALIVVGSLFAAMAARKPV
ncbi:EamA family transporter [Neptunomonas sp. XY-337]|uniref:aromatic amino acid exporter YddG n=1 Tax=Neptunomonas sp. XY-337 TaxID=2561897 RepID=UPI001F0FD9B0|nr:EamA family transporter [Neptunomonas sp. XY-337]